jgi:alpha-tubulin suppressor-like RCC1 family protein
VQVGSLTNWSKISCGSNHTASIKTDGTLWTWGLNAYGRSSFGNLGLNDTVNRSSPTQVGTLTNWSVVACGVSHTAATKTDGTLWTWGFNTNGQLGLNDTVNRSSPTQVGTLTNWSVVACGQVNTAAIKTDGTLWTWGHNGAGGLGLNDIVHRSSPVQVGSLTGWTNVFTTGVSQNILAAVGPFIGQVTQVPATSADMGDMFVPAEIFNNNGIWAWGINGDGQLGLNDVVHRSSPVQVGSLTNWNQVFTGWNTSVIAIKTDGTLWSWGVGLTGTLGLGASTTRSSPVQVGLLTVWKKISISYRSVMAITNNGTLWAWGQNTHGTLGLNDLVHRSSPVQVGSLSNWNKVSCGTHHTVAIKTDGTLWTWGRNSYGQLGLNDLVHISSPVQVGSLTNWKFVSAGGPASIGDGFSAAIKTDGTLWTWGNNTSGQLGLNDVVHRSSPVQVGSLTNWKQVAAVTSSLFAIKTDGTLWSVGNNTRSQLGQNNTTSISSPVQVGSLTNWKQVTGGFYSAAAVKTDGTLWVWGRNYGSLGLNDLTHRSSPTQVGSLTNWKTVDITDRSTYAIPIQ